MQDARVEQRSRGEDREFRLNYTWCCRESAGGEGVSLPLGIDDGAVLVGGEEVLRLARET